MKKETRKKILWLLFNASTVATSVAGVIFGVATAANIFKFLTWMSCPFIVICVLSEELKIASRKDGPSMPPRITLLIDIGIGVICAAGSWFGYSALWAIAGFCGYAIYVEPESLKSEKAKKEDPKPCVEDLFKD